MNPGEVLSVAVLAAVIGGASVGAGQALATYLVEGALYGVRALAAARRRRVAAREQARLLDW